MEAVATTNRITPGNITQLQPGQIFVFGSNLIGRHGKGAAKTALRFGAKYGLGYGRVGDTFAIPTKDGDLNTSALDHIKPYVDAFIAYARSKSNKIFLVTEIGCGLAGYQPEQIAPLFKAAVNIDNICLPERFWEVLNRE